MFKLLIFSSLVVATLAFPANATCQMPQDAGRYLKSQSKQLYSLQYQGQTYSYWQYTGFDSRNQAHSHEVILKGCSLAFTGQGGQDVSWSIGVPRPVAIAFAKKEVERDIKRLGRAKIQALLSQPSDDRIQPERAEAFKALGFQLPSTIKIYPWIVRQ
jgi:hypothetical protein